MLCRIFFATMLMLAICLSAEAADTPRGLVLSDETKKIIEVYQKNPTEEVKEALFRRLEMSYDRMLARKKMELDQLKKKSNNASEIERMQRIFNIMVAEKETKIHQIMKRLSDTRLEGVPDMGNFLPLLGADKNIFIAYAPVTNEEYNRFIADTKRTAPMVWENGKMPNGKSNHPVTGVSYKDAVAYCEWLTKLDGKHKYRLPTEMEWELAAGAEPDENAAMNCALNKGTTAIDAFKKTLSASKTVDMWGNVWEWTSTSRATARGILLMSVKGGSWASPRIKCRTEYRGEAREPFFADNTLGFRVVRED